MSRLGAFARAGVRAAGKATAHVAKGVAQGVGDAAQHYGRLGAAEMGAALFADSNAYRGDYMSALHNQKHRMK